MRRRRSVYLSLSLSQILYSPTNTHQMETINKLLKKQAPKTNKRRAEMAGGNGETTADGEPAKPNPVFVRWINNKEGSSVSVTNEYLESPVAGVFQGGVKAEGRKMVEEVQ